MKIIRISTVWCTSCILTYHIFEEMKNTYKNIEFVEYDYDIDKEEIKNYKIGEIIPITIFIKNDVEVGRIIGEFSKSHMIDMIEKLGEE